MFAKFVLPVGNGGIRPLLQQQLHAGGVAMGSSKQQGRVPLTFTGIKGIVSQDF